ncbi:MAG: CaiB/BaiF CoA-transferase family protein [Emcibacteraceae bacterium]|nr:CaiB/BaiF CoA-transferase family protein [Emcibacteraceae bacterium]
MTRPYENIKILDLTHVLAGPFATYQFALLGADVIKIEAPNNPDCARGRGPDPELNANLRGLNFQVQAANKRAITLDLKNDKGRDALIRLVKDADVLVENYRTGAFDDLGLGYDDLKTVNPKLIYCSLSGFGNYGDRASVNAYDNTIQATSGIIDQSGGHKPGVSFVDYAAGFNAAFAISSALHQRNLTGQGTYISSSMLEVAMTLMAPEAAAAQHSVKVKRDKEAGISSYETSNGKIMVGAFTPDQNRRMWEMFSAEGYDFDKCLGDTDDWDSLWKIAKEMKECLTEIFNTKSADQWQIIFHAYSLPAERLRTLVQAVKDPQLEGYFDKAGDVILPKAAYHFEGGAQITSPPPGFSEHTSEILNEYGYSDEEIKTLKLEGVIK